MCVKIQHRCKHLLTAKTDYAKIWRLLLLRNSRLKRPVNSEVSAHFAAGAKMNT